MIEFKPIRLEDKPVIERYTMPSDICNCDLAFANMFCWQFMYHSAWAEIGGFLVIRFHIGGSEKIGYMQPVGEGISHRSSRSCARTPMPTDSGSASSASRTGDAT